MATELRAKTDLVKIQGRVCATVDHDLHHGLINERTLSPNSFDAFYFAESIGLSY